MASFKGMVYNFSFMKYLLSTCNVNLQRTTFAMRFSIVSVRIDYHRLKRRAIINYSKRHNKFLLPALAEAIYGSFYKAENEILKPLTIDKGRKGRERQCSYRYRQ